jgi:hypothetical protein
MDVVVDMFDGITWSSPSRNGSLLLEDGVNDFL